MNRKERKDLKEKQMLSFEIFAFSAADVAPCWLSEISHFFTASSGVRRLVLLLTRISAAAGIRSNLYFGRRSNRALKARAISAWGNAPGRRLEGNRRAESPLHTAS